MSRKLRITLFSTIIAAILGLIVYGIIASNRLDEAKIKDIESNISDHLYDPASDTLDLDEPEEEDLDGDDAIVEDGDYEVYEEDGGWDDDEQAPQTVKVDTKIMGDPKPDGKLDDLFDPEDQTSPKKESPKKTKPPVINSQPKKLLKDQFLVIVGTFKSNRNAKKKLRKLEKAGFSGEIQQLNDADLYSVVAGSFPNEADAEDLKDEIKATGMSAFVKD